MSNGYIERILRANPYEVARETPLQFAPTLSQKTGCRVLIKREDLQPVFSFKVRGAFNKMAALSEAERSRGVVAASAGNHAQGVALCAKHFGLPAHIYMPVTTPSIKVEAVRARGANVTLVGDNYDEANAEAQRYAAAHGKTVIHPYDDPDIIAGQGTIALELFRQSARKVDCVFVPVGGGGLIAGITAFARRVHPETKVIGVEPVDAACLARALEVGHPTPLPSVGIFADGVAVRQVGAEPFKIVKDSVSEVITVETDEICAAIKDLFEDNRSVAEPAGALALAGLKRYVARDQKNRGQTLVAIESGANINFDRLRHVAERTAVGECREALLGVTIPEEKGSFLTFCEALGPLSITEFNYRYAGGKTAQVFVGVGISGKAEVQKIAERLRHRQLGVVDLTANETAKLHVRFMVGGRAQAEHERLIRFEFPEKPGALLKFLSAMGDRWNISLFHYRNHGAAFGRVLAGIQVPPAERDDFKAFLDRTQYTYEDETSNAAYDLFLH